MGVVALAPDDAWAVGSTSSGLDSHQFLLHWDGTVWKQVKDHVKRTGVLFTAGASSADDIWAVGATGKGGHSGPWTEHFDGTAWRSFEAPRKPLSGSLNAVAVGSPSLAVAVGYAEDPNGNSKAFSEVWVGSRWIQVPVVNPGNSRNELLGATADSPTSVWAVGAYQDTNHRWLTFAESYC
jgi:hypothetical protein